MSVRRANLVNYALYHSRCILVGVHLALSVNAPSKSGLWFLPPPLERSSR